MAVLDYLGHLSGACLQARGAVVPIGRLAVTFEDRLYVYISFQRAELGAAAVILPSRPDDGQRHDAIKPHVEKRSLPRAAGELGGKQVAQLAQHHGASALLRAPEIVRTSRPGLRRLHAREAGM